MRVLVVLVALAAIAACSRSEPPKDAAKPLVLPRTCDRARLASASDEFERLSRARDAALARIEAQSPDEPVEYLRHLQGELAALAELIDAAPKIDVPRCLFQARDMYARYLEASRTALDMRRPGRDFSHYRVARETADTVHGQFLTELSLQKKNEQ